MLHAVEGGRFHGEERGLNVVVEHGGRHRVLQQKGAGEPRAGGEPSTALREGQHLRHAEDDVGVLAALVGVYALPVVPEQVSAGRTIIGESREQVEGLPAADPQGQVGRLDTATPPD